MKHTNINKRHFITFILPHVEMYTKFDTIRRLYHAEQQAPNVEIRGHEPESDILLET